MATIKATCPSCGQVDLTADDIELRVDPIEEQGTYGFECPVCVTRVDKPADRRVVRLLLAGGVTPRGGSGEPGDPPFTYDDLLDFHFLLEDEFAIEEFLEASS